MIRISVAALLLAATMPAHAADLQSGDPDKRNDWYSGDWYLTLGATGLVAPRFEGSNEVVFAVTPLVSLGRVGPEARFTSRNDNISLAVVDKDAFRAGATGKLIWGRDSSDSGLEGIDDVRWGGEVGGFAEVYPTDWLRMRAEARHGVRSHSGVVADVKADAFVDVSSTVRLSGGPRASWASSDFFDAFYGVSEGEAAASGLSAYSPGSGWRSAGVGGAVNWKATERLNTGVFAEYARLLGPASESSIVEERGSSDQFTAGVTATYRFDLFSIP